MRVKVQSAYEFADCLLPASEDSNAQQGLEGKGVGEGEGRGGMGEGRGGVGVNVLRFTKAN